MNKIVISACLGLALAPLAALAGPNTTVFDGTVSTFNGPNDLDLTGNIVYAVSMAGTPTVQGLAFSPAPVGYSTTAGGAFSFIPGGPYAFTDGAPADNAALGALMDPIRCCGNHSYNFAVTPGRQYQLQILWGETAGGNTRIWDIQREGVTVVDEVESNGLIVGGVPPNIGPSIGVNYTSTFTAGDNLLTINLGNFTDLGGQLGADRNYVVSAFILEELPLPLAPEPGSIVLWGAIASCMGYGAFIRRRNRKLAA